MWDGNEILLLPELADIVIGAYDLLEIDSSPVYIEFESACLFTDEITPVCLLAGVVILAVTIL